MQNNRKEERKEWKKNKSRRKEGKIGSFGWEVDPDRKSELSVW
jgi:hypothetical protein